MAPYAGPLGHPRLEIMLQQTRVAAVLPYYQRFLARYPFPLDFATASESDMLASWAGLGYYSRARNLQSAARSIANETAYPRDYDAIRDLSGVGPYTAAAIASIAFGQAHAAVDGNVLRVLARVTADKADLRAGPTRARLAEAAQTLLDKHRPGDFNQALMELGAIVCLPRNPRCSTCPIAKYCEARALGLENQLPVKSSPPRPTTSRALCWSFSETTRYCCGASPPIAAVSQAFGNCPKRNTSPARAP